MKTYIRKLILWAGKTRTLPIIWLGVFILISQAAYSLDNDLSDQLYQRQSYTYGSGWVISSVYNEKSDEYALANIEMYKEIEENSVVVTDDLDDSEALDLKGPKSGSEDIIVGEEEVRLKADIDKDGHVGPSDFVILRNLFNSHYYDPDSLSGDQASKWNPRADIDGDGRVWLSDWGIFRSNFGAYLKDTNYLMEEISSGYRPNVYAKPDEKSTGVNLGLVLYDALPETSSVVSIEDDDITRIEDVFVDLNNDWQKTSESDSDVLSDNLYLSSSLDDMAKTLEDTLTDLSEEQDKTDIENTLMLVIAAIIEDGDLIDESTRRGFQEAVYVLRLAESMKDLISEASFDGIKSAMGSLITGRDKLYTDHLILTEDVYKELEGLLGIDIEKELLGDEYKPLNKSIQAKRKMVIDIALRDLFGKEDMSAGESNALLVYQKSLKPLEEKYQTGLNTILEKFIFSIRKTFLDVKLASSVEDHDRFKALFVLKDVR